MASVLPTIILATSTALGNLSQAEVEEAYWDCEFAATQGILDIKDAAVCSQLYEHLKKEKFLGNFDQFLAWWKKNKERELSRRMETR